MKPLNKFYQKIKLIEPRIYDRGKLKPDFINYMLAKDLPFDLLPVWDDNSAYREDWTLIGGEEFKIKYRPYYKWELGYQGIDLNTQFEVTRFVSRISCKIFEPCTMMLNSRNTDAVQLRITAAKIDKLPISDRDKHAIFDNLLFAYWNRKRVCDCFFYEKIVKFPFAPDFDVRGGEY